MRWLLVLFAEA
uniref:Uncharacterized protein n=1 Tax=Leuconostoc citreum TaxID=33964 RepID=A0A098DN42_LEUCI|nr:Protein of unknown function [Leuconostoc citreum]